MEVGYEMEDDLYFADLSKQISLLIMDDDDDHLPVVPWHYSSSLQGFSRSRVNQALPSASIYEEPCRKSETSKGTGVFIPKLSQPLRRRNRQGGRRFTPSPRSLKQHNNDNGMINHTIYKSVSGASPQTYSNQKSFQPKEILKGNGH